MNRKIAMLLAVLVLVLGVVVVLIIGKPNVQDAAEPTEPLPTSETTIIDKDKDTTATDGEKESEGQPENTAAPVQSQAPMPEEPSKCSYEVFYALAPEQKDEFLKSFESYDAFYEWLIAAQEEFKNTHPEIEIGPGGVIDLSKLTP